VALMRPPECLRCANWSASNWSTLTTAPHPVAATWRALAPACMLGVSDTTAPKAEKVTVGFPSARRLAGGLE
jgi:hypothetical protein